MWTTDNHLSIVSTVIESLESISNNREQVVVVIQPIVRCSSHWGESPQDRLGDVQTC